MRVWGEVEAVGQGVVPETGSYDKASPTLAPWLWGEELTEAETRRKHVPPNIQNYGEGKEAFERKKM